VKIIFIIWLLCSLYVIGYYAINSHNDYKAEREYKYRIIGVDSCEYIIFWDDKPNMAVVHKENCKNKIHIKN